MRCHRGLNTRTQQEMNWVRSRESDVSGKSQTQGPQSEPPQEPSQARRPRAGDRVRSWEAGRSTAAPVCRLHCFDEERYSAITRNEGIPFSAMWVDLDISLVGCSPWGLEESDMTERFPFTFHLQALEKEMATHSSVPAWRVPGTGEPGGLPSMGSRRVGHDCSNSAAAEIIT